MDVWHIELTGQARKFKRNLPDNILAIFSPFVEELINEGPYRSEWKRYSPLQKNNFHCHIKSGNPTYVVCWRIVDKKKKLIEVYYAGTHENAPY